MNAISMMIDATQPVLEQRGAEWLLCKKSLIITAILIENNKFKYFEFQIFAQTIEYNLQKFGKMIFTSICD